MIARKQIHAVNPMALALRTNISKGGDRWQAEHGFMTPVTMAGIGDAIDNAANAAINDVINFGVSQIPGAVSGNNTSLSSLDVVPYQNAVFQNVIKPIADQVNQNGASLSYQTLNAMLSAIVDIENRWLSFLHNTPWPTERQKTRAAAAEQTLAPYFTLYVQRITGLMQTASNSISQIVSGTPPIGTTPVTLPGFPGSTGSPITGPVNPGNLTTAGFSTPLAVCLGLVILYLFKKGKL